MNKRQLETYVEERFGIDLDLSEFMRQKIEKEGLYDYEIADQLNVKSEIIGSLRHIFKLTRRNGFSRRFEKKYGKGAASKFKTFIADPEKTLADAGRFFGFSREYARQVYMNIHGRPYTDVFKRKKRIHKLKLMASEKAPEIPELAKKISSKLKSMGFKPETYTEKNRRKIMVNGYRVELKSSSNPILIGKKHYFRIKSCVYNGKRDCDFLICLLSEGDSDIHYIIPSYLIPNSYISLSPDSGINSSKYARFREAWHLLKDKGMGISEMVVTSRGLINCRSRLENPNPVSEEIRGIIVTRMERGIRQLTVFPESP